LRSHSVIRYTAAIAGSASNGGGRSVTRRVTGPKLVAMAFPENQVPPPPPPPPQWPEAFAPPPPEYQHGGPNQGFYPLTIGRTVSLAFSMFRFGWRTFVAIGLIAAIPVVVVQSLVSVATYQALAAWQQSIVDSVRTIPGTPSTARLFPPFPIEALGLTLIVSLLLGTISYFGAAALVHAIATAITGGHLSTRASYQAALGRLKDILVLYVVVGVVGFGLSLLVVLGPVLSLGSAGALGNGGAFAFLGVLVGVAVVFVSVFLAIRFGFAVEALMIENLPAVGALRRSYRLMAGSMWRWIGYSLMFALIVGLIGLVFAIISFIVRLLIAPIDLSSPTLPTNPTAIVAQTLTLGLLSELIAPIASIGLVFLYFDIRWRHGETVPVPGGGETTGPPLMAPR
jgi:hypothetical protein